MVSLKMHKKGVWDDKLYPQLPQPFLKYLQK